MLHDATRIDDISVTRRFKQDVDDSQFVLQTFNVKLSHILSVISVTCVGLLHMINFGEDGNRLENQLN